MRFAAALTTIVVATISVEFSTPFAPETTTAAAARSSLLHRPTRRAFFAAKDAPTRRRNIENLDDAVRSAAPLSPPVSSSSSSSRRFARRYGPEEPPPSSSSSDSVENAREEQRELSEEENDRSEEAKRNQKAAEFEALLERIIQAADPNHLPSIASKNVDLILSLRGYEGIELLEGVLAKAKSTEDESRYEAVSAAIDYVMTFAEEFVNRAKAIDDGNKALLGKIVRSMTSSSFGGAGDGFGRQSSGNEHDLDDLLEKEKENFTPGFLRHVEGECRRIERAPKMTIESGKLLQTLRMIQTRVVEELGKDLGEAALVLGQLLGYDDETERYAVLDAGLTVRGIEFAQEMSALTEEALEGFRKVPGGGVDPSLVRRVEGMDIRIKKFIEKRK